LSTEGRAVQPEIPFTPFRGQAKQLDTDFRLPIMADFYTLCFSAFDDLDRQYARLKAEGIARIVNAAGVQLNFGARPRRFAGGPGLPPGRYFTLCEGVDFRDRGTLRDEITAYYSGDSGIVVTIFDPKVDHGILEHLQETGMSPEDAALPLYYCVYELARETELNAPLRHGTEPLSIGEPVGITYGVRQFNLELDRVVDLRDPITQQWFVSTFVALEVENKERAAAETGLTFLTNEVPETFAQLLPVIASRETGGGMVFGQAVGQWLRRHGVDAFIFPSARSNAFVKVRDGSPVEWGGWNMVVYAGAEPVIPEELFGQMGPWRDPDHDHIHVNHTDAGADRGSFSIRGVREFNLLDFDLKKQVACGVREESPALHMTGLRNEMLSRGANAIVEAERQAGTLWYSDVDYIQFVRWLEAMWREGGEGA
jgi:hypothetical protein